MSSTVIQSSQLHPTKNYDSKFIDSIGSGFSPLLDENVFLGAHSLSSPPSYSSFPSPVSVKSSLKEYKFQDSNTTSLPTINAGTILENFQAEISSIDIDFCEESGENAFFVCDLGNVARQLIRWKKELGGIVEPFFAVKCNPDPLILALFAKLGIGFDCASQTEISSVLSTGVHPDKIIYANPCKASSFVRNAAKTGVDKMTFDNADELVKVKKFHPRAKLVLRLLTDDSESLCRLGLKFGARLDDVEKLLAKAKELGLDVIGVSFHVGSGCGNPLAFEDAIHRSMVAFKIAEKIGYKFDFLDIGGGFNDDDKFETVCEVIRNSLRKFFPGNKVRDIDGGERDLTIIAEPGRYFVSKAFELATNIIARRRREDVLIENNQRSDIADDVEHAAVMYYINDGVYGAFNCTVFDHQVVHPHPLTIQKQFIANDSSQNMKTEVCSIWGPTCDSIDLVTGSAKLPLDVGVGDWLRWQNMGAYTICAASQFNGFKTSQVRYTIDSKGDDELENMIRGFLPKE